MTSATHPALEEIFRMPFGSDVGSIYTLHNLHNLTSSPIFHPNGTRMNLTAMPYATHWTLAQMGAINSTNQPIITRCMRFSYITWLYDNPVCPPVQNNTLISSEVSYIDRPRVYSHHYLMRVPLDIPIPTANLTFGLRNSTFAGEYTWDPNRDIPQEQGWYWLTQNASHPDLCPFNLTYSPTEQPYAPPDPRKPNGQPCKFLWPLALFMFSFTFSINPLAVTSTPLIRTTAPGAYRSNPYPSHQVGLSAFSRVPALKFNELQKAIPFSFHAQGTSFAHLWVPLPDTRNYGVRFQNVQFGGCLALEKASQVGLEMIRCNSSDLSQVWRAHHWLRRSWHTYLYSGNLTHLPSIFPYFGVG
ncbi:hypothetical protein BKA69DRAFT_1040724 [Paraphysoderma sedebokerense]|nr:hypothetical protein BKA69DRAFT_1040724 [Paraphysoderma sedebokerense]